MQLRCLLVPALVPAAFFAGTLVNVASARAPQAGQQPQSAPTVMQIDYMKIPATGNADEYVKVERGIWKAIHQERIKQGGLRSWALYRLRYPYGTKREYDYVTVNMYNSIAHLDREYTTELVTRAVPNVPIPEIVRRTGAARDLVRGDCCIWSIARPNDGTRYSAGVA